VSVGTFPCSLGLGVRAAPAGEEYGPLLYLAGAEAFGFYVCEYVGEQGERDIPLRRVGRRPAQQLPGAAAQIKQVSVGSDRLQGPFDTLHQGRAADEPVPVFVVGTAVLPVNRAFERRVTCFRTLCHSF